MNRSELKQVFEENYEWFKRLLRIKFISLNDYDIEDLIQQAALKLLYKDNLVGIKNLASYVYTMLENGAKDHFKKHSRETLTIENAEESEEPGIEESVLKWELKEVIMRSIERLDKDQRYVFMETEIKGRSYDELVRETGEKLGTLLSRKSRAAKRLKEMIREYMDQEDM